MNSFLELYGDYKNSMLPLFEQEDAFFGQMLETMERGKHEMSLFSRYFEKKIDMRWVDAIEECIIPLDTIVRNPRKFIVQEEEIVPIERAKKITAESVRHLAQHTNMIARVDDDRVTPSEILNVFREESYEIYENRFIFTLLRNLRHFIEARYKVLANLAEDENMSSLKMVSEVPNGDEIINYKLEISTKYSGRRRGGENNKTQDFNADAFTRIERIKHIVDGFCSSSFMRDLQSCTPVRPPIMRTNVIQKDTNFRACLNLWQFISAYNEVGYEIIAKESDSPVDDNYKNDLYKVAVFNYLLLGKNTKAEEEFEAAQLKKRKLKPKFVKRLAEEMVLNYDMEEVEIRRIFVDELKRASRKKISGEVKIKEAISRALASESARKAEIEAKIRAEIQRRKDIEKRRKEREAAKLAREKALEKERREKEKARLKAKKERELALEKERKAKEKERARQAKLRELEKARIAKEKEKARIAAEKERQARLLAIEEEKKQKAALAEQLRREKALALELERKEKEKRQSRRQEKRLQRKKLYSLKKRKLPELNNVKKSV